MRNGKGITCYLCLVLNQNVQKCCNVSIASESYPCKEMTQIYILYYSVLYFICQINCLSDSHWAEGVIYGHLYTQQTRGIGTILVNGWASLADNNPAIVQHWAIISRACLEPQLHKRNRSTEESFSDGPQLSTLAHR